MSCVRGDPGPMRMSGVAEVVNAALQTQPPDGSTHWNVRAMACYSGVSRSTVQRWFNLFAIQPHRQWLGTVAFSLPARSIR